MDPFVANLNLSPPRQRVYLRGIVPALLAHALLGVALASGVQWKRTPDPARTVAVPGLQVPAGSAATPVAALPPSIAAVPAGIEPGGPGRVAMGAAAERPATPTAAPEAPVRPSFDCARARSSPERIICADPELSRRDRELGRLHARAKAAAPDPAAFNRQNDKQWRRRESSCRDRACLLAWYDHRREQLMETLEEAGRPAIR